MKKLVLTLMLGVAMSGCGAEGEEPGSIEEPATLSSGIYSQVQFETADGCHKRSSFEQATEMQIGVHTLSETSLVAHLPGNSLRYEIDGTSLESPNVFFGGDIDYRDEGIAACDGLARAYDCVLHNASDETLSGTIVGTDEVRFSNAIRYVAVGSECDLIGESSASFRGVTFPCETTIVASYRK